MIKYRVSKSMSKFSEGKYYAQPVIDETVSLEGLAEHLANHSSPFSKGTIMGLLTDMVTCVKEILLEGKNVKLDNLAIFSVGIKNRTGGAETEDSFTTTKNISGVKFRARATGSLSNSALDLEATLRKYSATAATTSSSSSSSSGSGSSTTDDGGGSGSTGSESDGGFQG